MRYNQWILDCVERCLRFDSDLQEEVKYFNSSELNVSPSEALQLCISRSVLFHFDWIIRIHIVLDYSLIDQLCKRESSSDQSVPIANGIDCSHLSFRQLTRQTSWSAANKLSQLMAQYEWTNSSDPTTKLVDRIQTDFQCCGSFNGSDSWEKVRPKGIPLGAYPLSCCDKPIDDQSILEWCDQQSVDRRVSLIL